MIHGDEFDEQLAAALLAYETGSTCEELSGDTSIPHSEALTAQVTAQLARAKACVDMLRTIGAERRHDKALSTTARRDDHLPADLARRTLGRFEIIEELGLGGFGIVYRAWDPTTRREVALKIPRLESLVSVDLRRRFEQEAQAAARLDHPHIATVLEAGMAGVVPYIASIYYPGVTLSTWLREHPVTIPPRVAARFIERLAQALAHAHQRGVLHRDIKPSNILLVPTGDGDAAVELETAHPRLLDFGLAKLTAETQDMTHTGMLLGTIRYMPPEQAAGRAKDVGASSDVYALGAVLYELLAGAPPFAADSDLEVLRRIESSEPSRLRSRARAIPRDLETICLKCLEKDPARRYPTARALSEDLQRFLDGRLILARRPLFVERISKWVSRNPALAGLISVSALAMTVFVIGLAWSNVRIKAREQALRQYTYNVDMRLAQEAWDNSMPQEARALLQKYVPQRGEVDLRRMEWHYLNDSFERDGEVLFKQATPVHSLIVTADGQLVATGDNAGTLRVWSRASRQQLWEQGDHALGEIAITVPHSGRQLFAAGKDGVIRVWNAETGRPEREMREHTATVVALSVSFDDHHLFSGDADGKVLMWDLHDFSVVKTIDRLPAAVRFLAAHPADDTVIVATADEAHWWRYPLEETEPYVVVKRGAEDTAWRRGALQGDDLHVLHGTQQTAWKLNHTKLPGSLVYRLDARGELLSFAPSITEMVAGRSDGGISVASLGTDARIVRLMYGHGGPVHAVALLDDNDTVLSGGEDRTVRRWQLRGSYGAYAELVMPDRPLTVDWHPSRKCILAAMCNSEVGVAEYHESWDHRTLFSMPGMPSFVFWDRDDEILVIDEGSHLRRYDTHGAVLQEFSLQPCVHAADFDLRSGLLTYCSGRDNNEPGALYLIRAADGKMYWQVPLSHRAVQLQISESGLLLCRDQQGMIRAYDVAHGQLVGQSAPGMAANRFNLSADGTRITLCSGDRVIRVCALPTFEVLHSFVRSASSDDAVFVDDDRRLLVISGEQFELLDAETGLMLLHFANKFGAPTCLALDHQRAAVAVTRGNRLVIKPLRLHID